MRTKSATEPSVGTSTVADSAALNNVVPCCPVRSGDFPRSTRKRARARHGVSGMMSKDWVERMVAARLAEHDERVRFRRAGKAATGARWQAVVLARERATEERARLRELRNKPCGARTRAGIRAGARVSAKAGAVRTTAA